jgi:glutamate/tyrosine decarboxylase-like PLP-dependent enzyme
LFDLVAQHPEFEAACEPPMSAICIRYRANDLQEADAKKLHANVVERVEKSGKFWISTTELKGKTWFRINPVNFRTRTEHMEQLLTLLEAECRAECSPAPAAS